MIIKSKTRALLAGVMLCAAGIVTAQAQSTYITFSVDMGTNILLGTFNPPPPLGSGTDVVYVNGTYNGWGTGTTLVEEGSSTVFTNTVNDTDDANGGQLEYKFEIDGSNYESPAYNGGNNRIARLPATSGASLVLPTPFFADAGGAVTNNVTFQVDVSEQIVLGTFTNGISYAQVNGIFNGWGAPGFVLTNNPNIVTTNANNILTTNVWQGTFPVAASQNANMDFKYTVQPQGFYESPLAVNLDNNNNREVYNATYTTPLVNFSDEPFAPLSSVTFSVDMSAQLYYSNWNSTMPVYCAGINGDWSPPTAMTNNPGASNTNIYYQTIICPQGSDQSYKFTYNNGATVYEEPTSTGGNNRSYVVPEVANVTVPTVFFSDLSIYDLLTTNIWVTFTVNMTNASQYPSGPAFNPGSDTVYVNGEWINWDDNAWDPIDLAPYQLTNYPVGSELYSGSFLVPEGNPIDMIYKYSIDGSDNEAAENDNHGRYILLTASGAYTFPTDTFGNQYNEPAFGQLAVGLASGGKAPVSWLGAPNVQLQTSTNLTEGAGWVSHPETSGVVWTGGTLSNTNGSVTVTNWPAASGNLFFRLIQQ